ncbi:hypothetical protein Plo01_64010 [Planobispora longispora]|uniref:Uncharacterized protein n=1 Tax=Planobispora longispora TaxID=28887 RepID=A0A8J3RQK5_9ACTN|nr:hypothetical protein Plo01_64010 [Planobispora longispora]
MESSQPISVVKRSLARRTSTCGVSEVCMAEVLPVGGGPLPAPPTIEDDASCICLNLHGASFIPKY